MCTELNEIWIVSSDRIFFEHGNALSVLNSVKEEGEIVPPKSL